ncbi:uncharacterized protein [Bombus flavifrons]|uniref:uncharacterized protein n=1 Tax=Bombus flavifrons TaxID=103934 RepID=UPI0037047F4B
MVNSPEELLRAQNSIHNSTSEVGSEPLKAIQEQMSFMRELIQTLAQKPRELEPCVKPGKFSLPRFIPEVAGADPAAWCSAVSRLVKDNPLRDSALYSALNEAVEGSAAHWLTQTMIDEEITWSTFKERFLVHFGGQETTPSSLMKVSKEPQGKNESLGAYYCRLYSLLKTRWRHSTKDEMLTAIILFLASMRDQRFKRLALTSDIKTEDQFRNEMRPFCYEEEPTSSSRNPPAEPEAKRRKLSDHQMRCHYCGTHGHKIMECRKRMRSEQRKDTRHQERSRPAASSKVICFKCRAEGHIAPDCPLLQNRKPGSKNERRVDSCVVESPAGSLSHLESFITGFPRTRVSTGQLEIRLIDPNVTIQRSPYRLSEEEWNIVRERISELIRAKIVKASNSPFASPMLLVKKKDGSDRLCVDFRTLNKNTVANRYPLLLIADQIARLQSARYFISLDMACGFHQIPIHPNLTEYTAFVTPDGQYEYVTMPFGLKNAPAVFQRAIFKALGDLAYSHVVVYLDDVLIIANSVDQALERLNIVLDTLVKAGFSFNFSKCSFLMTSVLYLGYVIRNGEVRSLPAPTTATQLRQFTGLASNFRKFVPKFSQVMKPLYALTSGNKNIN